MKKHIDFLTMNPCDSCPIADKIHECCGRFPETGETAPFFLEKNLAVSACPHLNAEGRCRIYGQRPLACQMHSCYGFCGDTDFAARWWSKKT